MPLSSRLCIANHPSTLIFRLPIGRRVGAILTPFRNAGSQTAGARTARDNGQRGRHPVRPLRSPRPPARPCDRLLDSHGPYAKPDQDAGSMQPAAHPARLLQLDPGIRGRLLVSQENVTPNGGILLILQGHCTILLKMHGYGRLGLLFPCKMSFRSPDPCSSCNNRAFCAGPAVCHTPEVWHTLRRIRNGAGVPHSGLAHAGGQNSGRRRCATPEVWRTKAGRRGACARPAYACRTQVAYAASATAAGSVGRRAPRAGLPTRNENGASGDSRCALRGGMPSCGYSAFAAFAASMRSCSASCAGVSLR